MKRIIVISDTHIPHSTESLPEKFLNELKSCDICFHLGDFVEYPVFEFLSKKIKTYGVCGNMDEDEIQKKLPLKQIVDVDGVKFGLTHGRGFPGHLINTVQQIFEDDFSKLDVIVFGHSHKTLNEVINDKIFFNPGSLTDQVFAQTNSYGIIEVHNGEIKSRRIVEIE